MKRVQSTAFVVSLAFLAALVTAAAIHRHSLRQARHRNAAPASGFVLQAQSNCSLPLGQCSSGKSAWPLMMTGDATETKTVVQAIDQQPNGKLQTITQIDNPLTPVPAPIDATPVVPSVADESIVQESAAVRSVIDQELAQATREEREIWYEELKSLPAGVVRDLLQVRKQIRALPRLLGGIPEKLASAELGSTLRIHEIAADTASQKIRFNLPDQNASGTAVEMAISQLRHNLTNAATPGFKRLRVTLVDKYNPPGAEPSAADSSCELPAACLQGDGCRIAPVLLDLQQGLLKKTSRQFDLAIDGEGFFVVRQGEKQLLTRCGALMLDRHRTLCLALADEPAMIEPAIQIPYGIREIQVSAEGVITGMKAGQTTLERLGQLHLARVPSPERLLPVGTTLFSVTSESGNVDLATPMANGLGEIQQGFLEQSNVDFEKERDEIDELSLILKSLPLSNPRSATASNGPETPAR